jgi:hypothetical protein
MTAQQQTLGCSAIAQDFTHRPPISQALITVLNTLFRGVLLVLPTLLLYCTEDLPPLVLPPIEYPGILAPAARDININGQIMELYLNSVLPGRWVQQFVLFWEFNTVGVGGAGAGLSLAGHSRSVAIGKGLACSSTCGNALSIQFARHQQFLPSANYAACSVGSQATDVSCPFPTQT